MILLQGNYDESYPGYIIRQKDSLQHLSDFRRSVKLMPDLIKREMGTHTMDLRSYDLI